MDVCLPTAEKAATAAASSTQQSQKHDGMDDGRWAKAQHNSQESSKHSREEKRAK